MTLYIYQPGIQPLGQFDCADAYLSGLKGGEIGTLTAVARTNGLTEKAAYDSLDGYIGQAKRAAIWCGLNANSRPLWLLDEGTTGYGTLFGSVIGAPMGLSTTGSALGPHTAAASGKVTCWDKPGLYAVSTDAVSTAVDALVVTHGDLAPGTKVEYTATGLLTATGAALALGTGVGRLVEFETSPFLVTTPASLVGATASVTRVVIHYSPAL
jgi:hypothetical protein